MKPDANFRVRAFTYCVILWLTNWSIAYTYDRELGITSSATDLRGLGTLISAWITFSCLRRIWKLLRVYLDKPFRVPLTLSLWGDWRYLLLLIPLHLITNQGHTE